VAEDITAFIGGIDEMLVEDLLFGLMWIRWDDRQGIQYARKILMDRWAIPAANGIISRSWSLLKLLFLPSTVKLPGNDEVRVRPESSILPLLLAGRGGEACDVARRRLYSAGLAPIRSHFPENGTEARIAAALLLPLRNYQEIAELVLQQEGQKA
jgi:CRISPR-associated protein Csx17